MILYTIGFTQKNAQQFFEHLSASSVEVLVDIRLNPHGQLAGFAKQVDMPYFLQHLANGCRYRHLPEVAPTKEILSDYRADQDWPRYVRRFEALMDQRCIPQALDQSLFVNSICCLLCSEPTAVQCHRRLVAERMARHWNMLEVVHL
jgi:uncharacterized protein (DUF488 family)